MGRLTHMLAHHRPLVLDGAMGTELGRRGIPIDLPLWSARALMTHPGVVQAIHEDYIRAGAVIITTNTFRTTRRTFRAAGMLDQSSELTSLAVMLACEARGLAPGHEVLIAGSVAPLEDCYRPDSVPSQRELEDEHGMQTDLLARLDVDILLLETMGTIREACAACKAAMNTGKDVIVSFLCRSDGLLYGGERLEEAVEAIVSLGPSSIGLNCLPAAAADNLLHRLSHSTTLPMTLYANVGIPGEEQAGVFTSDCTPSAYGKLAAGWLSNGVSILGGCCGTTPEHIREVHCAVLDVRRSSQKAGITKQ